VLCALCGFFKQEDKKKSEKIATSENLDLLGCMGFRDAPENLSHNKY
jgi:hypothetical protein